MIISRRAILLILFLVLRQVSLAHGFEKAETGFFIFYYEKEHSRAAEFLVSAADAIARDISDSLGFSLSGKAAVYLVRSFEEFKKAFPDPGHIPGWAAGVAYPEKNTIVLLLKKEAGLEKTFSHEVHHVLLGQAFKGKERVPRWLDEGLAMIYANEWSLPRLSTMTAAVLSGSLIPMEAIAGSFPADLRDAELAYCQSFYFISFLKGKFGAEAFKAFLQEYCKYKDFHGAVRLAYNLEWEKMDQLWRDYLKVRFSWVPIITSTSTVWFVATVIFLAGYVRKKRKSARVLKEWEKEEFLLRDEENKTYH